MTAAVSNLAHYQFQDDGADNNTSTLLGTEDVANTSLSLDTVYFLRLKVTNTGGMDVSNFAVTLQADIGGAGFFNVTTSSTNVRAVAGQDDDGDLCDTERLTDDGGTFATTGTYSEDGVATTITLVAGEMYEFCFAITFRSADLTAGSEEIDLKVLNGGAALNNLLVTAEATMPAAGGITETPDVGSLTLTGLVPTLLQTFSIAVPVGSLTLTGQTPVAVVNTIIAVPVGSLTLTGFAPTVERTWVIVPDTGTLVLTGEVPPIIWTDNHIRAPPLGSLTLAGKIPTVNITQTLPVPVGSGVFTGLVPTVIQTFSIDVPLGSLTLSGSIPTVVQTFSIDVPAGSLTLTGEIPTLNITQTLPVPAGSLSLTGSVPTLLQTFSIPVGVGSLTVSGAVPSLERSWTVSPDTGTLVLAGEIPTLVEGTADETIEVGLGSLTLTGEIPTLIEAIGDRTIPIGVGLLSLSGLVPTVIITSDEVVAAKGGGWIVRDVFDTLADRKRRDLKALKEKLEQVKEISGIDGEIAQLLHKDDEKELIESSLKELENLVKSNISKTQMEAEFNARVAKAFTRAAIQGNFSALQALDREMERVREEEAFFLLAAVMILQ